MTTLPFREFLDQLRDRGYGISLHEYVALGKLLERWDSTDPEEIRNGIAALIARDEHEVRDICEAFDRFYAPPAPPGLGGGGGRQIDRRTRLVQMARRLTPWAALLVLALVPGYFLLAGHWVDHWADDFANILPLSPASSVPVPVVTGPTTVPPLSVPPPPPDNAVELPAAERRVDWGAISWLAVGAIVMTTLAIWAARMRSAARQWIVDAWQSELAELPGPYHGTLAMKDFVSRLPRADVEDAATVLSRAFSPDWRGNELDVPRSLRATLRSGMQPHLIFKPRRVQETILVLQDISQSMAVHARRVDSLNSDLRKQGVVLEHWYFDGDVSLPARRPYGEPVPLAQLLRNRGDGPALVLSAGAGVPAALASADRDWVLALRRRERLVWVNPITDSRLWPAALNRLPVLVVPMTRAGLIYAAETLAHGEVPASRSLRRLSDAPPVTAAHVQHLRRLAAVVPYPTPEFLELLRQRFAPAIPESAVLYAVDARSASANLPFKMTDEEIRRSLGEFRAQNPALERQVREYLVKVLDDSEPARGSAAHLRWQASRAIHQVQLAELRGTDASGAIETLRQIHDGPLWEEVKSIVGRQPVSAGPAMKELRAAVGTAGRRAEAPAFAARPDGPPAEAFRWVGPGWRAAVVAVAAAAVVSVVAAFAEPFQLEASHLPDAYTIEYVPPSGGAYRGHLAVRANYPADRAPRTVQLFRDGTRWGDPVTLADDAAQATIPEDETHVYQVRAPLASGGLAASNSIFAPSVVVLIDVQPWATVSIFRANPRSAEAILSDVTPATFALPFGSYDLQLENSVNSTRNERIEVTPNGPRSFQFTMPGFSAEDLVNQLGLAGRRPASAR